MRLEELIGSLRTFEIELSKESKERKKLMELRAKFELPNDEGSEFLESVALLSKNFERALKRLNTQEKGNSQTSKFTYGTFNSTKPGKTQGTPWLNLRNKQSSIENVEDMVTSKWSMPKQRRTDPSLLPGVMMNQKIIKEMRNKSFNPLLWQL